MTLSHIFNNHELHCITISSIALAQFPPVIVMFIMFSISEVVNHVCMVDANAYMQVVIIIMETSGDKEPIIRIVVFVISGVDFVKLCTMEY